MTIDLHEIHAGLEADEFFLEYLPVVDLRSGRCVGAEALARWRRPSGVVSPGDFIPIVENSWMSGRLTYWVFDQVASDLMGWLRSNPDVYVAINVPPEVLGRGGLDYAGDKSGLALYPKQLVLEITERGIPDLLGMQGLEGMQEIGIRCALDDVTLSGVNLAIWTRCAFSILKLDRTAVFEITPENPRPEWLEGLLALLGRIDLDVIAEGIETELQLKALQDVGVRFGQGFGLCRPVSAAGLFEFHAKGFSLPSGESA